MVKGNKFKTAEFLAQQALKAVKSAATHSQPAAEIQPASKLLQATQNNAHKKQKIKQPPATVESTDYQPVLINAAAHLPMTAETAVVKQGKRSRDATRAGEAAKPVQPTAKRPKVANAVPVPTSYAAPAAQGVLPQNLL